MYHLYHTEALVLGGEPQGEGSKRFALFTRELGFLSTVATSVREERSKLRYGLQDFSLSELSLVRGRELWRVTNATLVENLYTAFRSTPDAVRMFSRVFRLLRRLVVGEEKNERLFDAVREASSFLKAGNSPFSKGSGESASRGILNPPPPAFDFSANQKRGTPPLRKEKSEIADVEIILVLRILSLLGYLAPRGEFGTVLSDISLWNNSLLSEARSFRSLALSEINNSLKATQL